MKIGNSEHAYYRKPTGPQRSFWSLEFHRFQLATPTPQSQLLPTTGKGADLTSLGRFKKTLWKEPSQKFLSLESTIRNSEPKHL